MLKSEDYPFAPQWCVLHLHFTVIVAQGVSQVAMLPMLPQDNGHALMQDLPNIQPLYLRRQERHAPQQEQSFSIASTLDSLDLAKSIIESPLGVYDSAVRHNRYAWSVGQRMRLWCACGERPGDGSAVTWVHLMFCLTAGRTVEYFCTAQGVEK